MKKESSDTKVIITLPKSINVDLVPANELKHYERFQWLLIIQIPIAVGFWTAFFTIKEGRGALFLSALVFTLISLLFIVLSFIQRKKIFNGNIHRTNLLKNFK